MPSTTGPGLAPSVIPGPNTTTRPCDRSVTATAAPYAASLIASSPCSLPCSVTKPSTTLHGLTPPTPSPHDHKHSLYKRWGVRSNRGRRLAPREASRSEADVLEVRADERGEEERETGHKTCRDGSEGERPRAEKTQGARGRA